MAAVLNGKTVIEPPLWGVLELLGVTGRVQEVGGVMDQVEVLRTRGRTMRPV